MSETFGRLIIYRFGLPIAVLFLIGAALVKNIGVVVVYIVIIPWI